MSELLKDIANKFYNGGTVLTANLILGNTNPKPLSGGYSLSDYTDYDFKEAGKGFKEWRDKLMAEA